MRYIVDKTAEGNYRIGMVNKLGDTIWVKRLFLNLDEAIEALQSIVGS